MEVFEYLNGLRVQMMNKLLEDLRNGSISYSEFELTQFALEYHINQIIKTWKEIFNK